MNNEDQKTIVWDMYEIEGESEGAEVVLYKNKIEVARYELDFIVNEGLDSLEMQNPNNPEIQYINS